MRATVLISRFAPSLGNGARDLRFVTSWLSVLPRDHASRSLSCHATTHVAFLTLAIRTAMPARLAHILASMLAITTLAVAQVQLLGFACSDATCRTGIKSFPGPVPPAFNLPFGTNSWKAVQAGYKVCRKQCSDCDTVTQQGSQCFNKGPYQVVCPL